MVPGVVGSGVWISHNLEVYGKDGKQEQIQDMREMMTMVY